MFLSLSSFDQKAIATSPSRCFSLAPLIHPLSLSRHQRDQWIWNCRGDYENKVGSNLSFSLHFRISLHPFFFYGLCRCDFASAKRVTDAIKASPCDMLADADNSLFSLTGAFRLRSSFLPLWKCSPSFMAVLHGTQDMWCGCLKASSLALAFKWSRAKGL